MPTHYKYVTNGADDGYSAQGSFDNTRNYVQVGYQNVSYLRFLDITIPQGATINSAVLRLSFYTTNTNAANVDITAWDTDTASSITSDSTLQTAYLSKTTATVNWTFPPASADSLFYSPDISSIIQEVVDRPGWSSGNNLVLFLVETAFGLQYFSSRDYTSGIGTPYVEITYTESSTQVESGGSASSVVVTSVGDGVYAYSFVPVATADGPTVHLSWSAQSGATGYAIERDGLIVAWNISGTTYDDTPGEGEHTYRVGVIL